VQGQAIAGAQCVARPACIASSHQRRGCRAGQQDGACRLGGAGQKRSLSASAVGDLGGGTGLHLTPGTERQAWKSLRDSHNRRPATAADFQQGFLPGLLANSEMAKWSNPALSKPVFRKSPSRLPNYLGRERSASHQGPELELTQRPDTFAQTQPPIFTFRLQQGGGPYIPECRPLALNHFYATDKSISGRRCGREILTYASAPSEGPWRKVLIDSGQVTPVWPIFL